MTSASDRETLDLSRLKVDIGYDSDDESLLKEALTHPSVAGSGRSSWRFGYERLEFLGDRVLGLIVAEWLLSAFPDESEGDIAKRHAALVRREALVIVAETLHLTDYLHVSAGEARAQPRNQEASSANACEAVIAALYLSGGLDVARRFVHRYWAPMLESATAPPQDSKTHLQEWCQARGKPVPEYRTIERRGPDHEPEFVVEVMVSDVDSVQATGRSKRQAEKRAAEAMLAVLANEGSDDRNPE